MKWQSDEYLMVQVLSGNTAALTVLVERYHGPLQRYLHRLLNGEKTLAEDLVQETFLRVLRQSSYQPHCPFRPWVYAIATNLVRDYLKSVRSGRNDVSLEACDLLTVGPEEQAISHEQSRLVSAAISQLSTEYRITLILRFYDGLSLQEIADTLDIPLGTVKSRLSVGIRKLRKLLMPVAEERRT